ncbi:MAG: T9SS type A sorting domain-containing protein [Candidatus Kapabacteria bacterium]|nr:T9SS type A sorting domain-containing protein [Candidatus Kapabacteria bacterium]
MKYLLYIVFFQLFTIQLLFSSEPEVLWEYQIDIPEELTLSGKNYTKLGDDCIISAFELFEMDNWLSKIAIYCLNLDGTKRWEKMITYPDSLPKRINIQEIKIIDNDKLLISLADFGLINTQRTLDFYSLADGSLILRKEFDTTAFDMSFEYKLLRVNERNFAFGRRSKKDESLKLVEFNDGFDILNITPVNTEELDFDIWSFMIYLNYSNNSFTSFSIWGNPTVGNTMLNFDMSGNINWALQLNPPGFDSSSIYFLTPYLDNGYIVGGDVINKEEKYFMYGFITFDGELTWADPIQMNKRELLYGIKTLNNGHIAYHGTYLAPEPVDGQYITNAFINIIDQNGDIVNNFSWRYYPNSSNALTVEEMPNGNLIVGGTQTYRNLFVSMIKPVVSSIADNERNEYAFSIHPNPASEYIEIAVDINPTVNRRVDEAAEIKIYNTLGECVMTVETIHELSLQRIDISHLSRGVYYLCIGSQTQMFVKM